MSAISASLNDGSDVPFARISHINAYATELTRVVYGAVFLRRCRPTITVFLVFMQIV